MKCQFSWSLANFGKVKRYGADISGGYNKDGGKL